MLFVIFFNSLQNNKFFESYFVLVFCLFSLAGVDPSWYGRRGALVGGAPAAGKKCSSPAFIFSRVGWKCKSLAFPKARDLHVVISKLHIKPFN